MSQEEINELKNKINEIVKHRYIKYKQIKGNYLKRDSEIITDYGFLEYYFKDYILSTKKFRNRKNKKKYIKILNTLDFYFDDQSDYKRCGGDDIEDMTEIQWNNRLELIEELISYEKAYILEQNQNKLRKLKETLENTLTKLNDNDKICPNCNEEITNDMFFCYKCGTPLKPTK